MSLYQASRGIFCYQASRGIFWAKAFLFEGEVQLEVWDEELTPMLRSQCSIAEWAKESLSYFDLYDLLNLPKDKNFQVVFNAEISGEVDGWSGEYDEDIDIISCKFEEIPQDFLEHCLLGKQNSL